MRQVCVPITQPFVSAPHTADIGATILLFVWLQIIYQCPQSGTQTWHNEYLIDRGTTFAVAEARLAEEVSCTS